MTRNRAHAAGHLSAEAGFDLLALLSIAAPLLVERAVTRLSERGFPEIRTSHGRLFQHLQVQPQTITDLATLTGVTPQAVSKTVGPLADAGYVEVRTRADDGRVREVALSDRGRRLIQAARDARAEVVAELVEQHGAARVEATRALLVDVLAGLGVLDDVETRRIELPPE